MYTPFETATTHSLGASSPSVESRWPWFGPSRPSDASSPSVESRWPSLRRFSPDCLLSQRGESMALFEEILARPPPLPARRVDGHGVIGDSLIDVRSAPFFRSLHSMCCDDPSLAQDLQRGRVRERVDVICHGDIDAHKDEHGFPDRFLADEEAHSVQGWAFPGRSSSCSARMAAD